MNLNSPENMPKKVIHSPPLTQSDPDLRKTPMELDTPSSASQKGSKRYRMSYEGDHVSNFEEEIKDMIDEWKNTQNELLQKVLTEVAEIKKQNSSIKKTNEDIEKGIAFLSTKYDEMLKKVDSLEKERKNHLLQIATLETKVEDMEKNLKASSVEIRNLPTPVQRETKQKLCDIVLKTSKLLKIDLNQRDVKDVYRVGNKTGKSTIIADLTSVLLKTDVIQAAKSYNKQNPNQRLNSTAIGIPGPQTQVYISEALTSKARRLFFLARDLARSESYKFCWTSNGRVYLRKSIDSPHIEIKEDIQLASLRSQN